MALGQGQAFISVEADLKPFAKELNRQVPLILKEAEKAAKDSAGKTFGSAGKEGARSFDRAFKQNSDGKKTFTSLTASLAEALDDGISALPAEVKAALIIGLVASLPIVGALLTGAVSAALILGFAGVGVLIAAQFEDVREAGARLSSDLRNLLVRAGESFVEPVLNAIESIRSRFGRLEPAFEELFATASKFIDPVTDALLSFVEGALPGLQKALEAVLPLLPDLVTGAALLGEAIGVALQTITESEGAEESLQTLLGAIIGLVIVTGGLVRILTDAYDILLTLSGIRLLTEGETTGTIRMKDAATELIIAQEGVIAATKAEEKAFREQERATKAAKKALDDYINAQFAFVHSEIDFERALDDLTTAVKEHGKSLNIEEENGRKVAEAILRGLKTARQVRDDAIASGKKTDAEAEALYQKELARLRKRATDLGIAKTAFDELAASVAAANKSPLNLVLSAQTKKTIEVIKALIDKYLVLFKFKAPAGAVPFQPSGKNQPTELAVGGIVSRPTVALVGEAGPEAVVPLNRPERAAQVMAEAGIGGTGDVYVYVGNEQLDSRMVRVARGTQRQQASRLYGGTRSAI